MAKKLMIASDHAGFFLKEKVKNYLRKKKIDYEDLGAFKLDKNDDYPDYALKLAKKVKKDKNKGLLLCGSATGMAIAANKVKGIRAAVGINEDEVFLGRSHNDINVLCLNGINYDGISKKLKGKRLLDVKTKPVRFDEVAKMIDVFLNTKFEGGRHTRRLRKIAKIESS